MGIHRKITQNILNRTYRFRLYPNLNQRIMFAKTFGCVRFIYNQTLTDKIKFYKETKKNLYKTPAQYKKDFEWLKEVDSLALANSYIHLETAYNNFFHSGLNFPKFKSKKSNRKSYTTNFVYNNIVLANGHLKLPKVGLVKIKQHREIPSNFKIKSVTITKVPSGKYYASILFEYQNEICEKIPKSFLGLDFSLHSVYRDSNGNEPNYPKYFQQNKIKLKKAHRIFSKTKKGSKNKEKQRIKLAKIYEKLANQHRDFFHKLSKKIANEYDCVCTENLDLQEMAKSLNFGKTINDNCWGMFTRFLFYKLKDRGKHFIKVDKFFASSQLCNICGYRNLDARKINLREWDCPQCGTYHDRDINAAINIKNEGMRLIASQPIYQTVGHTGLACECLEH